MGNEGHGFLDHGPTSFTYQNKNLMYPKIMQPFITRFCTFCSYTPPRYWMSFYRTIGPLVFSFFETYIVTIDLKSWYLMIVLGIFSVLNLKIILLVLTEAVLNGTHNIILKE